MAEGMTIVRGYQDPALRARVVRSIPLLYTNGADPALDRPAHVRAGSGVARIGGMLAVVQDDSNFIALVDPECYAARSLTLPPGEGGVRLFGTDRGNKQFKLDLEACVTLPGPGGEMLVAFGSGSTPMRERIVLVRGIPQAPSVEVRDASAFYALLRGAHEFSGSEMNVEGAAWRHGRLLLFNRGNGTAMEGRDPVDATCEVDWTRLRAHLLDADAPPPAPERITRYELGGIDGWRLTFTDASVIGDALLFAAAAEASPNAYDDGPVAGSALGVIDGTGARWAVIDDASGGRFDGKVEGIAPGSRPGTVLVVIDRDDPRLPSQLCEVELSGSWASG
ncbi:MAG TPA: hypothetical protein VGB24_18550 [Longimicrobium sp.]|jgi:hypothetical protein|uniref:DUF6929 family protein n=1 Tax=Longimicrobium sp. TaxID=2029185 RepID=UPI002ED9255A